MLSAKRFSQALKQASHTVNKANPLYKLEFTGELLKVSSFDMVSGTEATIECDAEPNTYLVPAKILPIVNKLSGELSFAEGKGSLDIKSKRGVVSVEVADSDVAITLPEVYGNSVELPLQWLLDGLHVTSPFTAKNPVSGVLQAVRFHVSEGDLYLCATDGHRLALSHPIEVKGMESASILPSALKALSELKSETITYTQSGSLISFEADGLKIVTRQLDGSFPPFQQLFPTSFANSASVDRDELLESLQIVSAANLKECVTLDFSGSTLKIEAGKDAGAVDLEVELESKEGLGVRAHFGATYLLEALMSNDGEAKFLFNAALQPFVIDFLNSKHLLMPLQKR